MKKCDSKNQLNISDQNEFIKKKKCIWEEWLIELESERAREREREREKERERESDNEGKRERLR